MLQDNPDLSWEQLGKRDAYFGVLSQDKYRSGKIDRERKEEFFRSGRDHIEQLIERIERCFGPIPRRSALDFGCGVGRLVIPLAREFELAVGLDISRSMIEEARDNCRTQGVENVEFVLSDKGLRAEGRRFDFVHTFIVLQHVPKRRGLDLIEQLIDAVGDGGAGAIHFIFFRDTNFFVKLVAFLRRKIKPVHFLINCLGGAEWDFPLMQMNHQNLNDVLPLFYKKGIETLVVELTKHTTHFGAMVMFRKPSS